jgi:tyrosinase
MDAASKDFDSRRRMAQTKINQAFTIPKTMNEFSRTYIEDVHGWVHFSIGGNVKQTGLSGHMWPTEYSAFDPIFMLHHA